MKVIYPGSFDPFTLGHLDIVRRAAKTFGKVVIAIAYNNKKRGFLPLEVKIDLIKSATKDIDNIEVIVLKGLVIDYAREHSFDFLLRGIRAASDFEQELEMSQVNRNLSVLQSKGDSSIVKALETVFLMTSPEYSFIRASRVWELLELGGDISGLVPDCVESYLEENKVGYLQ